MTLIKKIVVIMFCLIIFLGIATSVKGERNPETGEILPTHTFYADNDEDFIYFDWLYNGDEISGLRFSNVFSNGEPFDENAEAVINFRNNDDYKYYCLQKGQKLFQWNGSLENDAENGPMNWTVEKVREINRQVIETGYFNGIEISGKDLKELARYAYILRNNTGHLNSYTMNQEGGFPLGDDENYTNTQKLLYYYANRFFEIVASEFANQEYNFAESEEYILNDENNSFDLYWNDLQYMNGELNIDISKAKQEIYQEDGHRYLSYGPITYKDLNNDKEVNKNKKLKDFSLSINGEEKIYHTDYWVYRLGNKDEGISGRVYKDPVDIEPNEEFYISIDEEKLSNDDIVKINAATEYIIYGARMVLMSNNEQQALMLVKNNKETLNHSQEITFNAKMNGKLNIKKKAQKEDGTEIYISGGEYKIYEETKPNEYKTVTIDNATEGVTIDNLAPGRYIIEEIKAPEGFKVELQTDEHKRVSATVVSGETNKVELLNIPYANIQIQKVDADTGSSTSPIKQEGVVFKIYYEEGNIRKYIGKNFVTGTDNTIAKMDWTTNENEAKEFVTGADGKTEKLIHIPIHTYYAKEISLTEELHNYYDIKTDPDRIPLTIDDRKGDTTIEEKNIVKIANKQKYVSISGYVWKDKHYKQDKTEIRNDLYHDHDNDSNDEAYNNVLVTLRNKEGEVLNKVQTNEKGIYTINGGEYRFIHVPIDQLDGLYIEFTYDGLMYQSVGINVDKDNGSKATDRNERKILDDNSKNVINNGPINSTEGPRQSARVLDKDGTENFVAVYDSTNVEDEDLGNNHVKLLGSQEIWNINATTKDSYKISREIGELEIKNINLGVYEKPQADFALTQDVESIKVGINGQWHIYKYGTRNEKKDTSVWDIGARFKDANIGTYTRPIYQSDIAYTDPDTANRSKELEVYLNYKIEMQNQSTYIGEINTIQNYYDTRYQINGIGNIINTEGNPEKGQNYTELKYGEEGYTADRKYKTVTVNAGRSLIIGAGESKTIYIQFKMDKEAIKVALEEETVEGIKINGTETKTIEVDRSKVTKDKLLYNIAEISSYTVYYNEEVSKIENLRTVAAVDKDSIPGNITPGEVSTYEDDTEAAPPVLLVKAGDKIGKRTITGNVFEDIAEINEAGKESNGNGKYDIGKEKTIDNIEVTLHEINQIQNGIQDQTYITKDGMYEFKEYIPGQYIITFTWGDKTYKVQNYKGTIYNEDRYNANQRNKYWYKDNIETRNTDAIDNYETRLDIDNQMAKITDRSIYEKIEEAYKEGYTGEIITKMTSTTPIMEFGVEYIKGETEGQKQNIFEVKNVDFGIIERPAQRLELRKRVSNVKLILANQQELVNIQIDEEGKITGTQNYLTYMRPEIDYKGNIRIEMDKELIQGATLEVGYEFTYTNISEIDYMSRRYYLYGTKLTTDKVVTVKPSRIVDYLDKELVYNQERNDTIWEELTTIDLEKLNPISEHKGEYLKDKKILCNSEVGELKPQEKAIINLNTSKYLGITDDLVFENEADTVKIEKPRKQDTTGETERIIEQQIGKVVETFPTSATAESVTIMQSTGENHEYVTPTIVGIVTLIITGVGIVIIKKKVVENK